MLIEIAVGASLLVLGALAVRRTQRIRREQASAEEPATGAPEGRAAEGSGSRPTRARAAAPRGLRVGDVILHADTEHWLAGEIYLDEEGFALALFPTPGGASGAYVAQIDERGREIAVLAPCASIPEGTVPAELPVSGIRLSLRRRGRAAVGTLGEHLPPTTERARYAILGGSGGRVAIVVDFEGGDRLALSGEILTKERFDLLPGGDVSAG